MITSVEKFKASSIREVEIPGILEGETFTIAIKPASMLTLAANGKIPNELMNTAKGLFDPKQQVTSLEEAQAIADSMEFDFESIKVMSQLMDSVCEAVMYDPKFEEVRDYLTDGQKQAIFEYSQAGVRNLTPSDTK